MRMGCTLMQPPDPLEVTLGPASALPLNGVVQGDLDARGVIENCFSFVQVCVRETHIPIESR